MNKNSGYIYTSLLIAVLILTVITLGFFNYSLKTQVTTLINSVSKINEKTTISTKLEISCPAVDSNLNITNANLKIDSQKLVPVETKLNLKPMAFGENKLLVSKFFSTFVGKDAESKISHGSSPSHAFMLLDILGSSINSYIVGNDFILPEVLSSPNLGHSFAMNFEEKWYVLSLTPCPYEMGVCKQTLFAFNDVFTEMSEIQIPSEFSPVVVEMESGQDILNKNTNTNFTNILGIVENSLVFELEGKKEALVTYSPKNNEWKSLNTKDKIKFFNSPEDIFNKYSCFSYTTKIGNLVFMPTKFVSQNNNELLDVYLEKLPTNSEAN